MTLSPALHAQIADVVMLAANGHNAMDCKCRIIALIETAQLTANSLPTEPFAAPVKRPLVELASLPV